MSAVQHIHVHSVIDGFYPYFGQLFTIVRGCVACNGPWPWPLPSRSLNREFLVQLPKYCTCCHILSTACAVMNGFVLHLAHMFANIRALSQCQNKWWLVHWRILASLSLNGLSTNQVLTKMHFICLESTLILALIGNYLFYKVWAQQMPDRMLSE